MPLQVVNLLSRALIVDQGKILLAHYTDESFSFLPGGYVEHGEATITALHREIAEDLKIPIDIHAFVGCLENMWENEDEPYHEINFIFRVSSPNLKAHKIPLSTGGKVLFFWHPLDHLKTAGLLPPNMVDLIPQWLTEDTRSWWYTDFDVNQESFNPEDSSSLNHQGAVSIS